MQRQGQKLPEQHFTTGSEVTFLLYVIGMASNDAAALELAHLTSSSLQPCRSVQP